MAGLCASAERIDEFDPLASPRGRSGASRRAAARFLGHAVAVARCRLRAAAGARLGARAAACAVFFRISRAPSLRSVRALAQPAPAAARYALAQAPPPAELDRQSVANSAGAISCGVHPAGGGAGDHGRGRGRRRTRPRAPTYQWAHAQRRRAAAAFHWAALVGRTARALADGPHSCGERGRRPGPRGRVGLRVWRVDLFGAAASRRAPAGSRERLRRRSF